MIGAERIGKGILSGIHNGAGSLALFAAVAKKLPFLYAPPVRRVFYKQIYFTGWEAFNKIAIIGTLIGLVIITQISSIVGLQSPVIGKILVWTIVRELGPLFCAIVIIARSCTAIASELGSMKINREVEALKIMGIDPIAYLIAPRIAGVTLSVVILTFYFQIFAIAGGLSLASLLTDMPFVQHIKGIVHALDLFEIAISVLKSFVFGLLISTLSCYHGLRVRFSITEIPQMTTVAVMQSLFIVILSDGIITLFSFV